ncbi:hypothetical protein YB2330_006015 [Saitoella coloradoensis]
MADRVTAQPNYDDSKDVVVMQEYSDRSSSQHEFKSGSNAALLSAASQFTPEERKSIEARLLRKVDLRMMPLLVLIYILNYLDRNGIAQARLQGLERDTGLVGKEYNTVISILYAGYILCQVPSNLFLSKSKPSVFLPACMIVWAIVSGATAATHNYAGLVVVRFFLGIVEAPFFPGALYLLSSWYTPRELGQRTALLYSGSLLSGAFGGLISAGILKGMQGAGGLDAWRWLFIIEGLMTIVVAVVAIFILPDFPATTKWLTEEERIIAQYRLIEASGATPGVPTEDVGLWKGFRMGLKDYKIYVLMLIQTAITTSACFTNYFPTMVKTLGYDSTRTLLLTAPPYLAAFFSTYLVCRHADIRRERTIHIVIPVLFAIAGYIILLATPTTSIAPRYVALFLMTAGIYPAYNNVLTWVSSSIPGPPAKRATALALVNGFSNIANLYGSYLFPAQDGPKYTMAWIVLVVFSGLVIGGTFAMRWLLKRENVRLEEREEREGLAFETENGLKRFRYIL